MGLLNTAERRTLIDTLLKLPNINSQTVRAQLLIGQRHSLRNQIGEDAVPLTHITNIVNGVDPEHESEQPPEGWPILILLDQAIFMAGASWNTTQHLQTLLTTLQQRAATPPGTSPPADSTPTAPQPGSKELTQDLFNQIRTTLHDCGTGFGSNNQLKALFADPRLSPWQRSLPEEDSVAGRIDATLAYLRNRRSAQTRESALLILVRVLADRTDPGDDCRSRLNTLLDDLTGI